MIMKSLMKIPILSGVWELLLLGIAVGALMGQIAYSEPSRNNSLPLLESEVVM
jgi:hypothetical protein